ncbi:hypothetical protein GE061_003523 [Apolygus lucorum]|uniref:Uncharacterized protein n=1 Tax=Apolygus lucorum TaxID=248454 RepID=A0A6A4JBF0_APOLU|nr:hypothetical protein GE061_003523 [Apolygus lucorum]
MNFYENLTNNLYNFFTCFPEYVERWDNAVRKTIPDINLVLSLAECYVDVKDDIRMFSEVEENTDLVHLQRKTRTTVALNLEENMSRIRKNQDSLYVIVEDLLTKLDAIERAASKVPEINSSTGYFYNIPRLNRLREYAEDATKFYQTLYLQIDTAMSNVDYLELLSIKDLLNTWDQKAASDPHIREILAFITFTNPQNAA